MPSTPPLPRDLTPPRQATPRNHDRGTYGGHAALIASAMGHPLIPWQRYVADVALECDEDGVLVYPIVLVTVQRQAGKTDLDMAAGLQNATMGTGRRIWYTAQTGQDASEKWNEMADTFEGSKLLRPLALPGAKGIRRANGTQALTLVNGSKYRPHPPTRDSLHGKQSDRNTIDEAWAFTSAQGADLKQAIGPTTTTRRIRTGQRPQLWIISTEGTVESTFLNPLLDAARGGDPEIAFFDWGLLPDDDPTDLNVVYRRHPGAGFLLDMGTLRDQQKLFSDSPGEFARAFGNRRTGASERLIPKPAWNDAAWHDPMPAGRPCLAAAVGIDGVDTTIAVGIRIDDGPVVSTVVKDGHRIGTHWAVPRIVELATTHQAPIVIDRRGPSAALYDAVKRAGVKVLDIDSSGVSAAHQTMLEGITNATGPTWRYRPHPAADDASELATRRYFSDGAWVLGRRASVGSISALESLSLAAWGADHLPEEHGVQLF